MDVMSPCDWVIDFLFETQYARLACCYNQKRCLVLYFSSHTVDDVEMCRGYIVRSIVEITSMTFLTFFPARRGTHFHSWSVFFLTSERTFGDFELVSKSLFRSIGYRSRIFSNPAGAQIDAAQPPNCLVSKIISRFVKRFIGKAAHYSMLSKQALEGRMWYTYMTVVCYVSKGNF